VPDILVSVDQLAGIEHAKITPGITAFSSLDGYDIAISHSLVTNILWAVLFAVAYFCWRRNTHESVVLFAVVFSHWLLDFVSHTPEMPLIPGVSHYVGLGLWNSIPATFAVEGALWLVAIVLYLRSTRSRHWLRTVALCVYIAVPTLAWITMPLRQLPAGDF